MTTAKTYKAEINEAYVVDGKLGKYEEGGLFGAVKFRAYNGDELVASGDYAGYTADEIAEDMGDGWDFIEIRTYDGELVGTIKSAAYIERDAEVEAEIRAELEAEIKQELAILDSGRYGTPSGKLDNGPREVRRRRMTRYHVLKLEKARKMYEELFGACEL